MRSGKARPSSSARSAVLALVVVALGPMALATAPARAETAHPSVRVVDAPRVQTLRAPSTTPSSARPALQRRAAVQRQAAASRSAVSTWQVSYTGFDANPQARQAFQAAVDIWAGLVTSSVPIKVSATFKDLGDPNVLGQAGPTDFAVLNNRTAYPVALANAISGYDVSPPTSRTTGDDIDAEFNNRAGSVYYGTDGVVPRGFVDFETVVLHELGHGLGFLGSMEVDSAGRGTYGGGTPYPAVYDRFTVLSQGSVQGKSLVSYPSGSTALGAALTGGGVYWDGAQGKAAYNGRPPRLYTPKAFEPASSYSHLSDTDFPNGDANALMTPFVENDEVIHEPGPIALGMFADMGWVTPSPAGVRYTPVDPVRVLDTRSGVGSPVRRLGAGQSLDILVAGVAGVPAGATAVVLNLTGVGPTDRDRPAGLPDAARRLGPAAGQQRQPGGRRDPRQPRDRARRRERARPGAQPGRLHPRPGGRERLVRPDGDVGLPPGRPGAAARHPHERRPAARREPARPGRDRRVGRCPGDGHGRDPDRDRSQRLVDHGPARFPRTLGRQQPAAGEQPQPEPARHRAQPRHHQGGRGRRRTAAQQRRQRSTSSSTSPAGTTRPTARSSTCWRRRGCSTPAPTSTPQGLRRRDP